MAQGTREVAHQSARQVSQEARQEVAQQGQQELAQGQGEGGIQKEMRASPKTREDAPDERYNNDNHQFNCDMCDFQSNQESELNNRIDKKTYDNMLHM